MVVGKLPTINVSKDAAQHQPVDKTLSQTSHVLGSSNKQPICVECDYVPLSGNSALLGKWNILFKYLVYIFFCVCSCNARYQRVVEMQIE